jgi:hypothetical protein
VGGLYVRHEVREVLDVAPELENLLHRGVDVDIFLYVDRPPPGPKSGNPAQRLVGRRPKYERAAAEGGGCADRPPLPTPAAVSAPPPIMANSRGAGAQLAWRYSIRSPRRSVCP